MIAATWSAITKYADDRGQDLGDEARARRADQAEQEDGDGNRDRRGRQAHGDDDAEGGEPSRAAADHQHVDEGVANSSAITVIASAIAAMRTENNWPVSRATT